VAKSVYIDTNEYCEEARLDTQKLINFALKSGLTYTREVRQADLVVFYACGHLKRHEIDSIRILKKIISLKKASAELVVWGCLPRINPESIRTIHKGTLLGPEEWDFFSDLFGQPRDKIGDVYANTLNVNVGLRGTGQSPTRRVKSFIRESFYYQFVRPWFIKVVSGCKNCCTYCSDRLAYRWIRSVPIEKILKQFEVGLRHRYTSFYLVGRDLGSYGYDSNLKLTDLLFSIEKAFSDYRYNMFLTNVSPSSLIDMHNELSRFLSLEKVFEIGSHIQSGSDRILKLMGKSFTVDEWIRTMKQIEKDSPETRIRTSMIVGFPTETEEDFNESVRLLSTILFDRVDVYKYEERPNIPSLKLKGRVPEAIKEKRHAKLKYLAGLNNLRKRIKRTQIFY